MPEMPPEDEILDELRAKGIARPVPEAERAGQTCLNPGCEKEVPENTHKTLNLGAQSGYCSVICLMEDEDSKR